MTNLVSTPPDPVTPEATTLVIDGWFPAVDVAAIRDTLRIGEGIVTAERMIAAVEGAVLTALQALSLWRTAHATAGIASLEDIADIAIGGRSRPVVLWDRIIRYYTGAELADNHRDITATSDGRNRADEENLTADEYRRQAHNAVADLLSIGVAGDEDHLPVARNVVDLI